MAGGAGLKTNFGFNVKVAPTGAVRGVLVALALRTCRVAVQPITLTFYSFAVALRTPACECNLTVNHPEGS